MLILKSKDDSFLPSGHLNIRANSLTEIMFSESQIFFKSLFKTDFHRLAFTAYFYVFIRIMLPIMFFSVPTFLVVIIVRDPKEPSK